MLGDESGEALALLPCAGVAGGKIGIAEELERILDEDVRRGGFVSAGSVALGVPWL